MSKELDGLITYIYLFIHITYKFHEANYELTPRNISVYWTVRCQPMRFIKNWPINYICDIDFIVQNCNTAKL
jgi:hypothetical protein